MFVASDLTERIRLEGEGAMVEPSSGVWPPTLSLGEGGITPPGIPLAVTTETKKNFQ